MFSAGKHKQEERLFAGMLRGVFFVRLKTVTSEYNSSFQKKKKKRRDNDLPLGENDLIPLD